MESIGEPDSRYRLYVAASNVPDLIVLAGGWVADHAMAGWDVTGFVADSQDDRDGQPLRILGAELITFKTARDFREPYTPHTLAIASELYERDVLIRTRVSRAVNSVEPEVVFLGDCHPSDTPGTPMRVEYQCSLAAQAFKAKALAATGKSVCNVAARELLFRWPTTPLSATDYATRLRDNGAAGRPLKAVSLA
jgi:hypothetical protein